MRRPHAKINLVAKRRRLLGFVEVKACATLDDAAFAATLRQAARIIDAAYADFDPRFEPILTMPRPLPHDLLATFDASFRTLTNGLRR